MSLAPQKVRAWERERHNTKETPLADWLVLLKLKTVALMVVVAVVSAVIAAGGYSHGERWS